MILVSKFQPNISQSLTLYWETQFAKIGVYLFMECEIIGKFENDVFELSPIKISMPLCLYTSAPQMGTHCVDKGNILIYFFLPLVNYCVCCGFYFQLFEIFMSSTSE